MPLRPVSPKRAGMARMPETERRDGPVRMCVICRRRFAKSALSRHVLTPEGIWMIDTAQRSPGRGFYLCADPACQARFGKFRPGTRQRGRRGRA